tara:strand:+ start:586 stop:774 length:189 start_codon:yes stop_codon:yes gene_type:complete
MRKLIENHITGRIICRDAYEPCSRDSNWGWYWFYTLFYGMFGYVMFAIGVEMLFGIELPFPS